MNGNNLLPSQVHKNPQMKNTTNLLILNLAVADLLFLLVRVGVRVRQERVRVFMSSLARSVSRPQRVTTS